MKKIFYFTVLTVLSICLFSCSSDDDDNTVTAAVSDLGTQENPASWGKTVAISGTNFSSDATFYLVPQGKTVSSSDAIKLTMTESTSTSLKFNTPFTANGGTYELYQVSANGGELKLSTVYLVVQRYVNILKRYGIDWSSEDMAMVINGYIYYKYNNGKLISIEETSLENDGSVGKTITSTYTYSGDNLTRIEVKSKEKDGAEKLEDWQSFKHEGSNITMTQKDAEEGRIAKLTIDNKGLITGRTDEWSAVNFDFETGQEVTVQIKEEHTYIYDSSNNLLKYDTKKYLNGVETAEKGYRYMEYDDKYSLFPKSALPAWYTSLFQMGIPRNVSYPMGYNNNVASYEAPGNFGNAVEFKYDYDATGYPTKIYDVLPFGNNIRFEIEYKIKE